MSETITIDSLAEILHVSVGTIYNKISHGDPLPPSIKKTGKRLWLRSTVIAWLMDNQEDTNFDYGLEEKHRRGDRVRNERSYRLGSAGL